MATISASSLCSLTGFTDRRHRQLAAAGYFPPPVRGEYDASKTIAGLFKYFREQLGKKDDRLAEEQFRLTRAKRLTAEEELDIIRDKFIAKAEIGPALRNLSLHQRATLQFKLETELPPKLVGLKLPEIAAHMRAAVDAVCSTFADSTARWLEPDNPKPTPKPQPKR